MTITEILKLGEMGFTAEQVMQLAAIPSPAPVPAPAPAPAPAAPAEPLKPEDNKRAVADVFASMMSRPVRVVPRPSPAAVPKGAQEPRHDVVGRNDPCPCGSGKKFKKCCGRNLV